MPKPIPVHLMTYERSEYFSKTVAHLTDNSIPLDIIVYDDNSQDKKKLEIMRYWEGHQRIKVIRQTQNLKPFKLLLKIWEDAFADPDAEYCIHIQDDVVVHPQWLEKLLDAKNDVEAVGKGNNKTKYHCQGLGRQTGIIAPCDRVEHEKVERSWMMRNNLKNWSEVLMGCCWLTTRAFYDRVIAKEIPIPPSGLGEDSYFIRRCAQLKMNMVATSRSWVKHVGVESIVNKGRTYIGPEYDTMFCKNLAEGL